MSLNLVACAAAGEPSSQPMPTDDTSNPSLPFDPGAGLEADVPADICVAPVDVSNAPRSVAEAVALVNALPMPVSIGCFLETLARPLPFYATQSTFSAQPAVGARSPRIFLFFDPLIMSVVPDGTGSHLLEFGELQEEARSLKAEIAFPVEAPLPLELSFERVLFTDTLTSCAFCHANEQPAEDVGFNAFVSQALRPLPYKRVALANMSAEFMLCDSDVEPARCAILSGLFSQGNVVDREFPLAFGTFF